MRTKVHNEEKLIQHLVTLELRSQFLVESLKRPNVDRDRVQSEIEALATQQRELRTVLQLLEVNITAAEFQRRTKRDRDKLRRLAQAQSHGLSGSARDSVTPMPGEDLRDEVEAEVSEEVDEDRLRIDYAYFAEKILKIKYRPGLNPDFPLGGHGPFILNNAQRKVLAILIKYAFIIGLPVRLILLKTRQLGCTTFFLGFWFWLCVTRPHFTQLFIIDKDLHFKEKRLMVIEWADAVGKLGGSWPKLKTREAKALRWDNYSALLFESSESTNPGTSEHVDGIHTSEEPKWVAGKSQIVETSMFPGISEIPGTFIVRESTAHGIEKFHFDWKRAVGGKSGFIPIFLPWFKSSDEYKGDPKTPGQPLSKDYFDRFNNFIYIDDDEELMDFDVEEDRLILESEYAEKYELSPERIVWRRYMIKTKFNGNRGSFDQEYPTTPDHAFRTMQSQYYPKRTVDKIEANLIKPALQCDIADVAGYKEVDSPTSWVNLSPKLIGSRTGEIFIMKHPRRRDPGVSLDMEPEYFLGVDTAQGIQILNSAGEPETDRTVGVIWNRDQERVAYLISRRKPEVLWFDLVLLAMYYNMACINGELDADGRTLLSYMWKTGYPRHLINPEPTNRPPRDRAWTNLSGARFRKEIINSTRKSVRDDPSRVRFEAHYDEMTTFIQNANTGKPEAAPGSHDDIILADAHAGWCWEFFIGVGVAESEEQPVVVEMEPVYVESNGYRVEDTDMGPLPYGDDLYGSEDALW